MSRFVEGNRFVAWLSATCAFAIVGCTWAMATARTADRTSRPTSSVRQRSHTAICLVIPVHRLEPGYRQVSVAAPLVSGDPGCFRHDQNATAACAIVVDGPGTGSVATSAGTAPPWYYLAVGWTARVLSSGRDTIGFRVASVLMCAAILGYAWPDRIAVGRGVWLLAAITPSAWFLFGVVGTSGVEVALIALALVEAVARFHERGAIAVSASWFRLRCVW